MLSLTVPGFSPSNVHVHRLSSKQWTSGLVCDEPFSEKSLHMSVVTQNGDSALMIAASRDRTEIVPLLLEAGANTDLQNKVYMYISDYYARRCGLGGVSRLPYNCICGLIKCLWYHFPQDPTMQNMCGH